MRWDKFGDHDRITVASLGSSEGKSLEWNGGGME